MYHLCYHYLLASLRLSAGITQYRHEIQDGFLIDFSAIERHVPRKTFEQLKKFVFPIPVVQWHYLRYTFGRIPLTYFSDLERWIIFRGPCLSEAAMPFVYIPSQTRDGKTSKSSKMEDKVHVSKIPV